MKRNIIFALLGMLLGCAITVPAMAQGSKHVFVITGAITGTKHGILAKRSESGPMEIRQVRKAGLHCGELLGGLSAFLDNESYYGYSFYAQADATCMNRSLHKGVVGNKAAARIREACKASVQKQISSYYNVIGGNVIGYNTSVYAFAVCVEGAIDEGVASGRLQLHPLS